MNKIPARITWPMAIITLLLANIGIAVGTMVLANQNGGVQVVPDYYTEAVAWDSVAAVQQSTAALGWKTELVADRASGSIRIHVVDTRAEPITKLSGTLLISRPQLANAVGSGELVEIDDMGTYEVTGIDLRGVGLFDVTIDARRGDERLVVSDRIEIP